MPAINERRTAPPLEIKMNSVLWTGIASWALLELVALLFFRDWLRDHDAIWWLWVPIVGIGLGLIGIPAAKGYERSAKG